MSWAKLAKKSSISSKLPSASTYPEDHQCVAVLAALNKIEKKAVEGLTGSDARLVKQDELEPRNLGRGIYYYHDIVSGAMTNNYSLDFLMQIYAWGYKRI